MATISFNPCRSFSTASFDGYFFTIKNHLCAEQLRRRRLFHEMKSTQLIKSEQPAAFSSTQEQYPSLFGKRFNLCCSQNDVQNKKTFSQQTIHAQIKDQPFESARTHFDIGFNKSSIATHRPTIIFLLSHKITTVQQKNNNQPEQSIKSNNPHNHSIKNKPSKQTRQTISPINRKINHTNNHDKQPTQSLNQKRSQNKTL